MPCVRSKTSMTLDFDVKSKSNSEIRFRAIVDGSRDQPQPCRLVPDPYVLTETSKSGVAVREHYFLEDCARAHCLAVGDHVASFSLDNPQQYMLLGPIPGSESRGNSMHDRCFKLGGSDDMHALKVDIGLCPSWRSLLIKDNFFELDFDGCGRIEIFKIEEVESISHVEVHIHFKCSKLNHTSFFKWFEDKSEFLLFRPFGSESLGRFHVSFQYLLEICYLFCHIIAKGLLERYDHVNYQRESNQHGYDSIEFNYDSYDSFKRIEGCKEIYESIHQFLQEANARRMRLLDFMPYGLHFRDDPTYKSCLFVANQLQDTLFLLKETFKNLFPLKPSSENVNALCPAFIPKSPLNIGKRSEDFKSHLPNQRNVDAFDHTAFDHTLCHRHNQRNMNRSICCYVYNDNYDEIAFDSFERFIDPFFVLHSPLDSESSPRDMRRLFSHLKRSIHSLELGHVCSFSTGLWFVFLFHLPFHTLSFHQVRLSRLVWQQFFSRFVVAITQIYWVFWGAMKNSFIINDILN